MSLGIPLYNLTLIGGSLTTSFVLFQNVTLTQMGIMQLLNQNLGPIELSAKQRARMFRYHITENGYYAIRLSALSGLLNLATAYLHPDPTVRRLTLASGICSFLVGPITFRLGVLKINGEICQKERANGYDDAKKGGEADERLRGLTKTWEGKHRVRYSSFFGAWVLNFAALLLVLARAS